MKDRIDIAVTGISLMGDGVLSIDQTIAEMMNNAQREIIIAGYSFGNSVPEIMQNLGKAAAKDVTIRIIFNKFENMKDTVKEYYLNLQKQWTNVRLYNYLGTNTSDLHVKAIAVDHTKAMIGSANFSYTAFETNYEISAVITGDSAYIIRNLLMRLLGVCEPVQ